MEGYDRGKRQNLCASIFYYLHRGFLCHLAQLSQILFFSPKIIHRNTKIPRHLTERISIRDSFASFISAESGRCKATQLRSNFPASSRLLSQASYSLRTDCHVVLPFSLGDHQNFLVLPLNRLFTSFHDSLHLGHRSPMPTSKSQVVGSSAKNATALHRSHWYIFPCSRMVILLSPFLSRCT